MGIREAVLVLINRCQDLDHKLDLLTNISIVRIDDEILNICETIREELTDEDDLLASFK